MTLEVAASSGVRVRLRTKAVEIPPGAHRHGAWPGRGPPAARLRAAAPHAVRHHGAQPAGPGAPRRFPAGPPMDRPDRRQGHRLRRGDRAVAGPRCRRARQARRAGRQAGRHRRPADRLAVAGRLGRRDPGSAAPADRRLRRARATPAGRAARPAVWRTRHRHGEQRRARRRHGDAGADLAGRRADRGRQLRRVTRSPPSASWARCRPSSSPTPLPSVVSPQAVHLDQHERRLVLRRGEGARLLPGHLREARVPDAALHRRAHARRRSGAARRRADCRPRRPVRPDRRTGRCARRRLGHHHRRNRDGDHHDPDHRGRRQLVDGWPVDPRDLPGDRERPRLRRGVPAGHPRRRAARSTGST